MSNDLRHHNAMLVEEAITQPRFFDWRFRYAKLDATDDPLVQLNKVIKWERFRSQLETNREKNCKNNAWAQPYDAVIMINILIIQSFCIISILIKTLTSSKCAH